MARFSALTKIQASVVCAVIGASTVVGVTPNAHALITQYTSKAAFEAALAPGAYTESTMNMSYPNYSGGSGFSYTLAGTGGPYTVNGSGDIATYNNTPSIFTFTFGPDIKAFGGYFYSTDMFAALDGNDITFNIDSGSLVVTQSPISAQSFYGFISDSAIAGATITGDSSSYATLGNVIVGTPGQATSASVPGPLPLFGAAVAFGWSRHLRQRLAARRPGA